MIRNALVIVAVIAGLSLAASADDGLSRVEEMTSNHGGHADLDMDMGGADGAGLSPPGSTDDGLGRIEEMIGDLGGHAGLDMNNGKVIKCKDRGEKKIMLSERDNAKIFAGSYSNCKENGLTRDGIYEVVVKDDEIVESNSRRSINGELFDAARNGDVNKVKSLIKSGADVDYSESMPLSAGNENQSISDWTPLMSSVMIGNDEMVRLVVEAGASVDTVNGLAVNALWIAANKGDLDIAKYLVKHTANVNCQGKDGVTPVTTAVMNGHYDVVRYLIDSKADVNLKHKDNDSALMLAISGGHTEIAKMLIEAGANLNTQNKFGVTPLIIAAAEGNTEVTRKLIEKKADITKRTDGGKTAFDIAQARGKADIIDLLKN